MIAKGYIRGLAGTALNAFILIAPRDRRGHRPAPPTPLSTDNAIAGFTEAFLRYSLTATAYSVFDPTAKNAMDWVATAPINDFNHAVITVSGFVTRLSRLHLALLQVADGRRRHPVTQHYNPSAATSAAVAVCTTRCRPMRKPSRRPIMNRYPRAPAHQPSSAQIPTRPSHAQPSF